MRLFHNRRSFHKILIVLLWIIFLVPFIIYGQYVFKYSVNIPVMDDFDTVLRFTNEFLRAQTPLAKLSLLFSQHNEHRLVFNRLVYLGYYYLFHQVNFKFYILFGNLGWIFTLVTLALYFYKKFQLSLLQLLPVPYILLTFIHRETMLFATPAIQYYWYMFFSTLCLIYLSKNKILLSCIFFLIALFTFGGGIVLYPLGNLYLVLQKKWKSFAIYFVASTALVVLYFFNYTKPVNSPSILKAIQSPLRSIEYFFSFLGNILPVNPTLLPMGIIIFGIAIYLFVKRFGDAFLHLTMGSIVLTALTAALTRSGFGISQAGSARYTLFPLLALVSIYIMFITSTFRFVRSKKIIVACAILFAMTYWGTGVIYSLYSDYFQNVRDKRIASIEGFRNGDINSLSLLYPSEESAAQILVTSEQQHIYNYENHNPDHLP